MKGFLWLHFNQQLRKYLFSHILANTVFPLSDLNTTEVCRVKEARYKISNNGLEMEAVDVQGGQREIEKRH